MSKHGESIGYYAAEVNAFYRHSTFRQINVSQCKQYERNLKWLAAFLIGNGIDSSLTTLDFEFHREQ